MAEHLVQLWIRSDDDPSGIDWQAWLPKSVELEHVQTRSFPWRDVHHEITWWITRPLTLREWNDLDDAESEVLARIVGEDHFMGTAGPIPELAEDHVAGADELRIGESETDIGAVGTSDTRSEVLNRYERALRTIVALVPDYEEARTIADERGAELANALTVGAFRAAEVARKALEGEHGSERGGNE
jgi:hypothetical protein